MELTVRGVGVGGQGAWIGGDTKTKEEGAGLYCRYFPITAFSFFPLPGAQVHGTTALKPKD